MMTMRYYYLYCCLFFMLLATSCEKLVEVSAPPARIDRKDVYKSDVTASAATARLYTYLPTTGFFNIQMPATLSADEVKIDQQDPFDMQFQVYQNEILVDNSIPLNAWEFLFDVIYNANAVIEGVEASTSITPAIKNQLLGEAKFIRAFIHFYLVGLFGNAPYITTTDYRKNALVTRIPVDEVYDKMIADLLEAKSLLPADYVFAKSQRVRANKWAATALLARTYLYKKDWVKAEEQATELISNPLFQLQTDLTKVFLKNSLESIWQVIPSSPNKYVFEGNYYFSNSYYVGMRMLTDELLAAFETNDKRKNDWTMPFSSGTRSWSNMAKYKEHGGNGTSAEYSTILRLAEQYLIRAEARAMQNKLTGANSAASDIDVIRNRAGLLPGAAATQPALLLAIEQERRVELFCEWGHRWFDLKRTGRATAVMSPVKPLWENTDVLFPIPVSELQLNPNMTQNPGY